MADNINDSSGIFSDEELNVTQLNPVPNGLSEERAKIQVLKSSSTSASKIKDSLAWGEFALGKDSANGKYDLWIGGKNDSVNDAQKVVLAHEFNSKIEQLKTDIVDDLGFIKVVTEDGKKRLKIGTGEIEFIDLLKKVEAQAGLDVTGGTKSDSLEVTNGTTSGSLEVTGATKSDSLEVTNGTKSDSLEVTNGTTSGSLDVTGATTSGSLEVTNLTKSGSLEVTNVSTLGGQVTANAGLDVTGGTKSDSLEVTGGTKSDSLEVTNATTSGSLEVTGATKSGSLDVTNSTKSGSLEVTNLTKSGSLEVTGDTSLSNVTISGSLTIETEGNITQIEPQTLTTSDNYLELNIKREQDDNGDWVINRDAAAAQTGGLIIHGNSDKDFTLKYDSNSEKVDFVFGTTVDSNGVIDPDAGSSLLTIDNSAATGPRMEFAGHIHAETFSGDVDGGEF